MSEGQTAVDEKAPANKLSAVLREAHSARIALDGALQSITVLLDQLIETDEAEQEYWSLCDEHARLLLPEELPPDLRSVLLKRQKQRDDLRSAFGAYREAARRYGITRREINRQL